MSDFVVSSWAGLLLLLAQTEQNDRNPVWEGWGSVIFVTAIVVIIAIVVVVLAWQILATRRATLTAREAVARDEAFRNLAEESATAQQRIADELARATEELAQIRVRVTEVERILKEVE